MLKDILLFGGLGGIIGNISKQIATWGFYGLGLINHTYDHFCAGRVVSLNFVKTPLALVLGVLIDYVVAATFGILFYRLIKREDYFDHMMIKGLFFGFGVFLICFCMLRPLFSSVKGFVDPLPGWFYLFSNLIYGLTTSLYIKKYDKGVNG